MTRAAFEALAAERSLDADVLLKTHRFSGAYYISGYAVECALKALIAGRTKQDDFPPRDAARFYTHDLDKLMDMAGLTAAIDRQCSVDTIFEKNWARLKDWSEEARYQDIGKQSAEQLVAAVNDPDHGVLQWLKQRW